MKVITCASYYGCGSSAVTDLMSECDCVKSLGDYEFRFLHDIDGISDLEHYLIECPNRHNSGHALKRFSRLAKFNSGKWFNKRYEHFFNGQYLHITKEYINKLITYRYKGFWFYDMYDKGVLNYYFISLILKISKYFSALNLNPLRNEYTYGTVIDEHKFIEYTQEYLHKLFAVANSSNVPFLMIDQLMPSSNIGRCLRYVSDEIRIFIVDRDPRDLYIMSHYVWKNEHVIPDSNVEDFCKWYRFVHECAKNEIMDEKKVLKIQFEDMIYNYDTTKERIFNFVGLNSSNHNFPFTKFNPLKSAINTQSWKKFPESKNEILTIEKLLPEYLYDFSAVSDIQIKGVSVEQNNHMF